MHPLGGGSSRQNIATLFGTEKLEWCGYPTVKKFRRYLYSFWHDPRTWQTNEHRMTAIAALMHSIARQKTNATQKQNWSVYDETSKCKCRKSRKIKSRKLKKNYANNWVVHQHICQQELSYRKQIARQLRTQFVEGISVTLKSTLRVTQSHWKRNHWTNHTRLTVRRVTGRWILSWPCGSEVTQGHWKRYHLKVWVRFPNFSYPKPNPNPMVRGQGHWLVENCAVR